MSDRSKKPDSLVISPISLRKAIGFLGISIPAVMIAGAFVVGGCTHIQSSISHYYFTVMGDVFVAFLIATGILLLSYKGYDSKDRIISAFAGIFILCVALFPTSKSDSTECVIRTLNDAPLRVIVHYFGAAFFYLILSYISLFLFTKSAGAMTPQKIARNRVYRICGITIIVAISLIGFKDHVPGLDAAGLNLTFWLEWVANLAYGVSWLVKGELVLKDRAAISGRTV